MREIKFRAKVDDMTREWAYGNLIYDEDNNPRIQVGKSLTFKTCLKDTECQFTGLRDMNGKEVYEGDIVFNGTYNREVVFDNDAAGWYLKRKGTLLRFDADDMQWFEVVGDTYTTPELLEGEK